MAAYNRLSEVAPRGAGRLAEQRGPRRHDALTERIARYDWHALAERSTPLPPDLPVEAALQWFGRALLAQLVDRGYFD